MQRAVRHGYLESQLQRRHRRRSHREIERERDDEDGAVLCSITIVDEVRLGSHRVECMVDRLTLVQGSGEWTTVWSKARRSRARLTVPSRNQV